MTEVISGTSGDDTINGTSGNDTILVQAGDDVITAGSGNDKVDGGADDDTIDGGSGNDLISGGSGDDTITGGSGNDLISGGSGDDTITGSSGNDLICGGSGTDTAIFGGDYATYDILDLFGLVVVKGEDGTDVVLDVEYLKFDDGSYNVATNVFTPTPPLVSVVATDGLGTETVDGTDFTFTFSRTGDTTLPLTVNYSIFPASVDGATPGSDFPAQTGTITFAAGSATAVLSFDALPDAVIESTEFFSVVVGVGAGYQVDIPNATANASITDGTIYLTNGPDIFTGTNNPEAIVGLDDDDVINGLAGDDAIYGGNGDDGLAGGPGNDYLDGGAGFDRAIYTNGGAPVSIMLAAGTATIGASMDTLRSIELARGTMAYDDVFNATGFGAPGALNISSQLSNPNFNAFEGLGGDDTIIGNNSTRIEFATATAGVTVTFTTGFSGSATGNASVGTDTFSGTFAVRGSDHNDLIINAGASSNTFDGRNGFDTVSYASAGSAISVNLQNSVVANVTGGGGNDVLRDNLNNVTIEGIIGTNFDDTFTGNGAANSFDGLAGLDIAVFGVALGAGTIIDNGLGGATVTTGPGGTDTLANVELLQFTDAYQLTSAGVNADLRNISMPNPNPIFGTGGNESITVSTGQTNRLIDLMAGSDTLVLGEFGTPNYFLNLQNVEFITSTGGIETVTLQNAVNGMDIDLATGFDTLNLASGGNVATVLNVETLNAFGSDNDTITFFKDASVNQNINLGFGTNVLNLAGSDGNFSMFLFGGGDFTVNGQTTAVDEHLNVLNTQLGTTFDLGAGNDDRLSLANVSGPPAAGSVTVINIEHVFGNTSEHDDITIGGNSGGVTTVTAGAGPDEITLSSDVDHVRFTSTGDSAFDVPFGGQRDIVNGFDANLDKFDLSDVPGLDGDFQWELINFSGSDIILIDIDGGGTDDANNDTVTGDYAGWEMAVGVVGLTGTLDNTDFLLV